MADKDRIRKIIAMVIFLLFNAAYAEIYTIAGLGVLFNLQSYDSTGDGGPFRACSSDSIACSGPNYLMILLCALVLLIGYLLSAYLGVKIGTFQHKRRAFVIFSGASFLFSVAAVFVMFRPHF